jgi:hypothetical protein
MVGASQVIASESIGENLARALRAMVDDILS